MWDRQTNSIKIFFQSQKEPGSHPALNFREKSTFSATIELKLRPITPRYVRIFVGKNWIGVEKSVFISANVHFNCEVVVHSTRVVEASTHC